MSLITPTPGTMLGLAARDNRRAQKKSTVRSPVRVRLRAFVRVTLAVVALAIGLSGFSMSSAQAWPWDDMKDNITATIFNMCGPNDVPNQATYTNIDTMAGLNSEEPRDGYRSTIKPDFKQDENGGQGGNGMERLQRVYGEKGDVIAKPTYERYGFSTLSWNNYGYECFSPTLMMGPLADMGLISMVHVPMMIAMAFLNFVMNEALYTVFASMMQPFIGAMYEIFNPWIYVIVPIGIGITWLTSKGSAQATLKAAGWGVLILSVYLLMGSSTSKVVSWATNIVTEVSGSAACKMNAAANGGNADNGECDTDEPIKAVQQALWYGIPYQTWHLGQVGEYQAALDAEAEEKGEVGWGPAILNGQYVGVDEDGNVDEAGKKILTATETWNRANYSPDSDEGKVTHWTKWAAWDKIPYLANIKIMCNDVGKPGNEDTDPSEKTRWMYSGNDGTNNYCDTAGAGTEAMVPHVQGDEYNKQMLVAMSGMVGVGAVALTIVVSGVYLGFQKMMFFFLLFLAPVVLLVSAIGDRKRRPFAVRYAEIIGANLLKQITAVCIVLFVSYSMASLFGSDTFGAIPWIMKPYAALLFFVALAFLAFPLKSMIQGAIKGDTSVIDKQATAPQRAAKNTAKAAAVVGAVAATGGAAAALGAGGAGAGLAGAGGKGALMGKVGSGLGQAGRVMGIGTKTGRAMRGAGQLLKAGQGVMESKDTNRGWKKGQEAAANKMIKENPSLYHEVKEDGSLGNLIPGAHQKALKNAQSTAERGVRTKRANNSQDDFMRKFYAGWGGPEAQRQPEEQPDDKPDPRPEPQPLPPGTGSRGALSSGGNHDGKPRPQDGSGESQGDGGPQGDPAPTGTPHSGGGSEGTGVPSYEHFAEKARDNLGGPAFAKEMDYNVNTVRSGDDVLTSAGLSKDDVIKDPTVLLSGDAYNGGSTVAMDPFHGATPALNDLRFASGSGNEDAIEGAVAKAVDAIHQHGVPNQIDGVSSIGARAENFESVQVVGAMPNLSENASWQERAEAAHTMQAAQVAMPADFAARESVENYTAALSRPGIETAELDALKAATISDISNAMSSSRSDVGGAAGAASGSNDGYAPPAPTEGYSPASVADAGAHQAAPTDGYTPAGAGSSGVSPEDLRTAVADGLREARLEHDAGDTGGAGSYDPSDARSSSPSAPPSGDRSSSGTSFSAPSSPLVDDDPVDVVDDSEALVYRPGRDRRKKKRSGFFSDPDESDEGGEN